MRFAAFVQARMSSRRFPGKMLAPFRGRPMIDHVVEAVKRAFPEVPVTIITSDAPSDLPLAVYAESRGHAVFRGPLDDVLGRFRRALDQSGEVDWVLRICGDSPLLSPAVLQRVVAAATADADLVTTTFERTFPRGQNAELVRAEVVRRLDASNELSSADREHVTQFIHQRPTRFRIVNVTSGNPALAARHDAVDTVEDLTRLEALTDAELAL